MVENFLKLIPQFNIASKIGPAKPILAAKTGPPSVANFGPL